jgi:hypothetical protein
VSRYIFTEKIRERCLVSIKYCFDDWLPLRSNAGVRVEDAMIVKDINYDSSPNLQRRRDLDHIPKDVNHNRISIKRPSFGE